MKRWNAVVIIAVIALLWWMGHHYLEITPEEIKRRILQFGIWAPVVYIMVYTLRPLLFFPATILCIAGGLAFGPYWGALYTIVGFTGDAILMFGLARYFGNRFVRGPHGTILRWKERLERKGFFTIVSLRLIPVVPFDLVSCAAGLSSIRFLPYVTGTILGTLPVTFAYSFVGGSLTEGWSGSLAFGLALVVLLAIVPAWIGKRRSRHQNSST